MWQVIDDYFTVAKVTNTRQYLAKLKAILEAKVVHIGPKDVALFEF